MLDRSVFVRPIAHRGYHDAARGRIENTAPAFSAAIARKHGIECDVRPAADGTPFVFHDRLLERLIAAKGAVADFKPGELRKLRYREGGEPILSLTDLLDLVAGQVPLLVEIKSDWGPPDAAFLRRICNRIRKYDAPAALMSFDPAVMAAVREIAPGIPRGIVSGMYKGKGWWPDKIDADRAYRLSHLLESGPADPHFYAYDVNALPTPVTRFVREVLGLPLFTWTVRTKEQLAIARQNADAPIYETPAL
jgi:glycerophosphoryl diester phosphodiesterase